MTKDEWVQRCRMRLALVTQDFEHDWIDIADVCYTEMYADFTDDPEGAADEELSNWD